MKPFHVTEHRYDAAGSRNGSQMRVACKKLGGFRRTFRALGAVAVKISCQGLRAKSFDRSVY